MELPQEAFDNSVLVVANPDDEVLCFGSGGFVHEGIHLVLDALAGLPDHELLLCGPLHLEPRFVRTFETSVQAVRDALATLSALPGVELERRARDAWEYAHQHPTREDSARACDRFVSEVVLPEVDRRRAIA